MRYDPQFLSSALFDEKPHHQKAMGYPRSSFKYIPPVHNSLSHTHIPSRFSQLKTPIMQNRRYNSKFLLLEVRSPLNSPSGAAMLRARAKRTNSNKRTPKQTTTLATQTNTTCSPASPRDLVGNLYDLQRYARLYAVLGTPPTFDLSRCLLNRRKRARRYQRGSYRVFTSTPRAEKRMDASV